MTVPSSELPPEQPILTKSVSRKKSQPGTSTSEGATDEIRKSHRKTVHYIACFDCGGTGIIALALLGAFLISLIALFEGDKRGRMKKIENLDFALIAIKVIVMIAMLLNVCICVQLMHHTKPENEKLDVLRRAKSWRAYNIFLVVILPIHVGLTGWKADYPSCFFAGLFLILRIGFMVVVHRYIRELQGDLTAFFIRHYSKRHLQIGAEPTTAAVETLDNPVEISS